MSGPKRPKTRPSQITRLVNLDPRNELARGFAEARGEDISRFDADALTYCYPASNQTVFYHPDDRHGLTPERMAFLRAFERLVPKAMTEFARLNTGQDVMDWMRRYHLLETDAPWIATAIGVARFGPDRYDDSDATVFGGAPLKRPPSWMPSKGRTFLPAPGVPVRALVWDPEWESQGRFEARARAILEGELARFVVRVTNQYKAAGYRRTKPNRRRKAKPVLPESESHRFEWLVKYQVLGRSYSDIALEVADAQGEMDGFFAAASVREPCLALAERIGLRLRKS